MRLFYVAATRARETLTLFYPAKSEKGLAPSRFLQAFLNPEHPAAHAAGQEISLRPGDRVRHEKLGEGKVVSIDGDTLTVSFKAGLISRTRSLSLSYCVQQKLLVKMKNAD